MISLFKKINAFDVTKYNVKKQLESDELSLKELKDNGEEYSKFYYFIQGRVDMCKMILNDMKYEKYKGI
jgi:hypothetical protein